MKIIFSLMAFFLIIISQMNCGNISGDASITLALVPNDRSISGGSAPVNISSFEVDVTGNAIDAHYVYSADTGVVTLSVPVNDPLSVRVTARVNPYAANALGDFGVITSYSGSTAVEPLENNEEMELAVSLAPATSLAVIPDMWSNRIVMLDYTTGDFVEFGSSSSPFYSPDSPGAPLTYTHGSQDVFRTALDSYGRVYFNYRTSTNQNIYRISTVALGNGNYITPTAHVMNSFISSIILTDMYIDTTTDKIYYLENSGGYLVQYGDIHNNQKPVILSNLSLAGLIDSYTARAIAVEGDNLIVLATQYYITDAEYIRLYAFKIVSGTLVKTGYTIITGAKQVAAATTGSGLMTIKNDLLYLVLGYHPTQRELYPLFTIPVKDIGIITTSDASPLIQFADIPAQLAALGNGTMFYGLRQIIPELSDSVCIIDENYVTYNNVNSNFNRLLVFPNSTNLNSWTAFDIGYGFKFFNEY